MSVLETRQRATNDGGALPIVLGYDIGKGVTVASPSNEFRFRLGGYLQADSRTFFDNGRSQSTIPDQFLVRSSRLILESQLYNSFSSRVMFEFSGNSPALLDAYADYSPSPAFNVRAGKAKDPLGIERLQSEQNILFVERGMTTNLVPYRDIGVQVYGRLIPQVDYQAGLVDGGPDLVNINGGTDNLRTGVARIFTHPFATSENSWLTGYNIGIAGSYGRHGGTAANSDLTSGYVTPGQAKFFSYSGNAFARGGANRINPELTYLNGPFSLISEYVRENQDVSNGKSASSLHNDAFMVTSTYVLTGEEARFDGVVPRQNFDPAVGYCGAIEVAGRYSQLNVDKRTFPLFASSTASARQAREATIGMNWYLNPAFKIVLDFATTAFKGGAGAANRPTERAVLTRAQLSF